MAGAVRPQHKTGSSLNECPVLV